MILRELVKFLPRFLLGRMAMYTKAATYKDSIANVRVLEGIGDFLKPWVSYKKETAWIQMGLSEKRRGPLGLINNSLREALATCLQKSRVAGQKIMCPPDYKDWHLVLD